MCMSFPIWASAHRLEQSPGLWKAVMAIWLLNHGFEMTKICSRNAASSQRMAFKLPGWLVKAHADCMVGEVVLCPAKSREDREVGDIPVFASWGAGASKALGAGGRGVLRSGTWQGRSAEGELPGGSHRSPQTQYCTASKYIFLRQHWLISGNVKHQSEQQA